MSNPEWDYLDDDDEEEDEEEVSWEEIPQVSSGDDFEDNPTDLLEHLDNWEEEEEEE